MRIFYAVDNSPNPDFASLLWQANLRDSFVAMGHEVVEFDYDLDGTFGHLDFSQPQDRSFIEKNRPLLSAELVSQVRAAHAEGPVSLFFSYFYDACVEPAAIEEIKSLGIVTMNWFCNASYQFHLVREISPRYDWCLVPEKFKLADYETIGAHPIYCQEAANPAVYKPCEVPPDIDVSFVGQSYGDRPDIVRHLLITALMCVFGGRAGNFIGGHSLRQIPFFVSWGKPCAQFFHGNPEALFYRMMS